mgnify:CR=1 FL=1
MDYALETDLAAQDYIALLNASGLGARRPVGDAGRIARMLRATTLLVTARQDGRLIGAARALTDHAWCCYLADLAVVREWQGKGIGRTLIEEVRRHAGEESLCLLLAAPDATGFYERIGMERPPGAFVFPRRR